MIPSLHWSPDQTEAKLHTALEALSISHPLNAEGAGSALHFTAREEGGVRVERRDGAVWIGYGSLPEALRGVGMALSGLEGEARLPFQRLGVMLDCSRNAVMTVGTVKRWLRQLALLGFNQVMLYTEDTYQLSGEPFFGYKRGGYTLEEIREMDACAASLGVELVACIQTLGHLHQILKWKRFDSVRDTPGVLLVDEEESYRLIEKMLLFWKEALGSRRIHIGMDEAHDMGRGRFFDRHGYEPAFEIFSRHLSKVNTLCHRHGLAPMIWSDMYFRMGNERHDYYDRTTVIPEAVRRQIPEGTQLVYWDYYSTDKEFYREWIRRHRELAGEPVMASGLWTWQRFWYDHATTEAAARPCIEACREEKLSELFFTLWGDGGGYCEYDSAWLGLVWAADLSFGGTGEEAAVAAMARGVCGVDAALCRLGEQLNVAPGKGGDPVFLSTLLWDDPLLGIGWEGYQAGGGAGAVREGLEALARQIPRQNSPGTLPDTDYLAALVGAALAKLALRERLVAAWDAKDRDALREIAGTLAPEVEAAISRLAAAFRKQWLGRNKPFGMEATQIRFGALKIRCQETATRIEEYLAGKIATIDELDDRREVGSHSVRYFYWLATGSANF